MSPKSVFALSALAATLAHAQTPPNTEPSTDTTLNVQYGFGGLTTNTLYPQMSVTSQPVISLDTQVSGTHMVMLVDLSISYMFTPNATSTVPIGLGPNRTTRLHWLQTGLSQSPNGTFYSSGTDALAVYGGPMPPEGDIAHTYTFYVFQQPEDFALPAYDAGRDIVAADAEDRLLWSVTDIADVAGAPIAANYYRVTNPNNTAAPTASGSGGMPSASSTYPPTFTGGAAAKQVAGFGGLLAMVFGFYGIM